MASRQFTFGQTFRSVAPTLAKASKLNLDLPVPSDALSSGSVAPSLGGDVTGYKPVTPTSAIGGKFDGRILGMGGYPLGKRGSVIGTPYSGTHSLGNWESDNAIDISVPTGTPVVATQDGTINKVYAKTLDPSSRFAGYQVHLGGGSNEWFYTHLSRMAKGMTPGTKVKKGQVIGYSGAANGASHLHLGVEFGNPLALLGLK
jgi:murein DD-endopeptidase MepM/ murein hydrolase activator NlpD